MSVVSGVVGAITGQNAANTQASAYEQAAAAQQSATNQSVALQRDEWNATQNNPYTQAAIKQGTNALNQYAQNTLSGQYGQQYTTQDFQSSPLYQTMMSQQLKTKDMTTAQQAASGMMGSGNMANAINQNLATLAGTYEPQAYNQWAQQNQTGMNALQSLSGLGQSSTNALNTAGQNYATNTGNTLTSGAQTYGNYLTGAGTASASGQISTANALSGMSSNLWNQGLSAYALGLI